MRSLTTKLALSHIIPTLLLLPMLSVYLLYMLEDFYTDSLQRQLLFQAQLLRDEVARDPALIADIPVAERFLYDVGFSTDMRVILLSKDGTIIASSEAEDRERLGTIMTYTSVAQALRGEIAQGVGPGYTTEVAYAVVPLNQQGETVGALRLSYQVADVRAQFDRLRWLVIAGVILTVVLALGLALGLSTTITRPLRQLSENAQGIAAGNYHARVSVSSRDEVGRLAQSFNRMTEQLEEAELARTRQLAAIVHELARPFTGMRAAVETLHEGPRLPPGMQESLVSGIENEMDRLERLIGTLQGQHQRALRPLRLSRIRLDLERVIRASAANFDALAERLQVTLCVHLPSPLPSVFADQDRIIQVLTNLLDNAFKFTPRGGRITVNAAAVEQSVSVTVADTGVGIRPDELPRVFQQFYRGDESRPPEKRGMGLGLTICRDIIVAHGGQISVESEPGRGARFTFTLPIA